MFNKFKTVKRLELKDINQEIKIVTVLFCFSVTAGILAANNPPAIIMDALSQLYELAQSLEKGNEIQWFSVIFLNNIVAVFSTIIGGLLLGLTPFISSIINGYIIGVVSGLAILEGQGLVLFVGLVPHGVIEIPALIIALAIGLKLGRKVWQVITTNVSTHEKILTKLNPMQRYIFKIRFAINSVTDSLISALKLAWFLLIPLVTIAALIEAGVTPYLIDMALGK